MNDEEQVRRLLEDAGPRPEVPPEDLARIKAAFRAEWKEHIRRRRSPDRRLWLLAASILLAAGLGWWLWPAPAVPVARFERASGPAAEVLSAAELSAGESPVGLRLAAGPSLRLDAGSQVRLVSASVIELRHGAVYLDSEGAAKVEIRTPLGVVTDVGTQFEARLLGKGEALRVRVREGAVRVGPHKAEAGTELTLRADGTVVRGPIAAYGPPWAWVLKAAPPLVIEGLTLEQFLDRIARETGWTVRYEDPGLAQSAGTIVLHGDIGDLPPDQAPEVVLPGAGLDHRLADGVLILRAAN